MDNRAQEKEKQKPLGSVHEAGNEHCPKYRLNALPFNQCSFGQCFRITILNVSLSSCCLAQCWESGKMSKECGPDIQVFNILTINFCRNGWQTCPLKKFEDRWTTEILEDMYLNKGLQCYRLRANPHALNIHGTHDKVDSPIVRECFSEAQDTNPCFFLPPCSMQF